MSLWTPYEPEQALDLTKSSKDIPQSPPSPGSEYSSSDTRSLQDFTPPFYNYNYGHESSGPSPSPPQIVPYIIPPVSSPPYLLERAKKLSPRPFKAVTAVLPDSNVADTDPNYMAYRATLLDAMRARNGGTLTVSNPRMRRSVRRTTEGEPEDVDYLQRRQRNNAAAKKSRDLRRQKEDELAIRAAYLERVNAELRARIHATSKCFNCRALC